MRKIRAQEREHGMRYCTFCKPERVDAVYRSNRGVGAIRLACEDHKDTLAAREAPHDDGHLTEADDQTWMRL